MNDNVMQNESEGTESVSKRSNTTRNALVLLFISFIICFVAGWDFMQHRTVEDLFPSPTLTRKIKLSEYNPLIANTPADTDVYLFDSGEPGGTLLVCGGTHPNEPAGFLSAVVMLENIAVSVGRVFIIPRTNATGFTHNDPQEAMLQSYNIKTANGNRIFRNGSRFTNPAMQWPDPTIYLNPKNPEWEKIQAEMIEKGYDGYENNPGPGGQTLAGIDSRNLNRTFPGLENGSLTEQLAWTITELIKVEKIDLAIDLHEAAYEYPTINCIVAHPRAQDISVSAELFLDSDGVRIATEPSPANLRGLSHREWGDATQVLSILLESANASQGRLKGKTTEEQITKGFDPCYARCAHIEEQLNLKLKQKAEKLREQGIEPKEVQRKILYTEYPVTGIPIEERVGRHLTTIVRLVESFNFESENAIEIANIPLYEQLIQDGLGSYLHDPLGNPPKKISQ